MIDRSFIGTEAMPRQIAVETYPLRFFKETIASLMSPSDPGDMTVPPTFLFCLFLMAPGDTAAAALGMELADVLHAAQSFTYHRPIVAGAVLTFRERIVDIYEKNRGRLEFVVTRTTVHDQDGQHVADLEMTLAVKNPAAEAA